MILPTVDFGVAVKQDYMSVSYFHQYAYHSGEEKKSLYSTASDYSFTNYSTSEARVRQVAEKDTVSYFWVMSHSLLHTTHMDNAKENHTGLFSPCLRTSSIPAIDNIQTSDWIDQDTAHY